MHGASAAISIESKEITLHNRRSNGARVRAAATRLHNLCHMLVRASVHAFVCMLASQCDHVHWLVGTVVDATGRFRSLCRTDTLLARC